MIPAATVTVDGVDISCNVEPGIQISHGRSDPTQQPEPATASLELIAADRATVEALRISAPIVISAVIGAETRTRFAGTITDVAVSWDDPAIANVNVLAASVTAMLGRTFIGDVPWPAEDDGDRAARILSDLSDTGNTVGQVDPGTVQILARDVDRQPILDLLTSLANDAGGMVWHTRDGQICYADAEHRRNLPSTLTLDCGQVLMSPVWTLSTDGLVNDMTVSYGVAPEGGDQPTVNATSETSIATHGRLAESMTTTLAAAVDATARVNAALARRSTPRWNLADIPADLRLPTVDAALTQALLSLEVGDLITVTGFPGQGPASTAALWVEGWDELVGPFGATGAGEWTLALHVSAYCRTSAYARWDDIDPAVTWDNIGTLTWDDASCLGPPLPGDRWMDVPANYRWDTIPATVTWDTWNEFIGA